MKRPKHNWQDMTTLDFQCEDRASWIAVLPVSAVEQHGPHLPLSTDRVIGEGLLAGALMQMPDALPVTCLPMQAVGKSNEHIGFPGTVTQSWQTTIQAWIEIGESVYRSGLRKLIIINSHGGNAAMIDIVAQELRARYDMLVVATSWMKFGVPENLFEAEEIAFGIHGGDIETSLMLHFSPELVDQDKADNFRSSQEDFMHEFKQLRAHGPVSFGWCAQDLNEHGVTGNATLASAEKGKALAQFQTAAFVDLCNDVHGFDLARLLKAKGCD